MEKNTELLKQEFGKTSSLYQRLSINLSESLKFLLNENGIPYLDVYSRVKDFDSFQDKIDRKKYEDPFSQIEDICGLRVVCYYPSDITKIEQIIKNEFEIINSEDKISSLDPDKFGYRSYHFIVQLKNEWLKVPNYRGLSGLKAEIQVRTILMHAWADISHKLSYKKKEHIPELFQRNLFQLSALFEIADDRFEILRTDREKYRDQIIGSGKFNIKQELNFDSLQAFLDFYFSNRKKDSEHTIKLLDELINRKISLHDILISLNQTKDILPELEKETGQYFSDEHKDEVIWTQTGVVRSLLELTNDEYWKDYNIGVPVDEITERFRAKLQNPS